MYRYTLPLIVLFTLACSAIPVQAQQNPRVWINADMDDLRPLGLISIVGPETPPPAPVAAPARFPTYTSRLQDPAWYAQQTADLRAQLDMRATALTQAQDNLLQARNGRGMTGSVDSHAGDTYGVTPEERIAYLTAEVQATQAELDELADLARRNAIPPGVLRDVPA